MAGDHPLDKGNRQPVDCYDPDTNTLDIRSNGKYPSGVLSNLCSNGFRFEGRVCGSMEGFLQSLKRQDPDKQRQVCSMKGGNARKQTIRSWQTDQIVWWKGVPFDRQGDAYQTLVRRAYRAMFGQNEHFRTALMATRGMTLTHRSGDTDPYRTILTAGEFCTILTELRDGYDKRDKHLAQQRAVVYVELDGVLADFRSGQLDGSDGPFGAPLPRALEAVEDLQRRFDLYVLSEASGENPSAWAEKVQWVARYLGSGYCERLVLTHCRLLCKGDYLITAQDGEDGRGFEGECICLGNRRFPDWETVIAYLCKSDKHGTY